MTHTHTQTTPPEIVTQKQSDTALCEADPPADSIPLSRLEPEPMLDGVTQYDLIAALNRLEDALAGGPGKCGRTMLASQSEILNSLFNALVAANLKDAITARFYGKGDMKATAEWLGLVLQTQKQCVEALKAASQIDYLDSLAGRPSKRPSPRGHDF